MSPLNNPPNPPISIFLDGSPNAGPSADDDARSVSSTNERPPITLQGLKDIPKKFMKLFPGMPNIRVGSDDPLDGKGIKSVLKSAGAGVASLLRRNKIQPLEDAKDGLKLRTGRLKSFWVTKDNLKWNTEEVIDTYCTVVKEVFDHRVLEDDVHRNVKRLHSVTAENVFKTIRRLSPDADVVCGSTALKQEFYDKVERAKKVLVTINSKPPQTSTYIRMLDGSWTKDGVADPGPVDFIKKAVDDYGATSVGVVIVKGPLVAPLIPPGKALTLQQMKDRADTLFSQKNYRDAELAYLQALEKYAPQPTLMGKGKKTVTDTATQAHLLDRLAISRDKNEKYLERNETLERLIEVSVAQFHMETEDAKRMKCLARIAEAAPIVADGCMVTDREKAGLYLDRAREAIKAIEGVENPKTAAYADLLRQKARLLEMGDGGPSTAEKHEIEKLDNDAIDIILGVANEHAPIGDEAGKFKLQGDYLRKHQYHDEASKCYQEALKKMPDDPKKQYDLQLEIHHCQVRAGKRADARKTDREIMDTLSTWANSNRPDASAAWNTLQRRRLDTARSLLRDTATVKDAMQHLIGAKKAFEARKDINAEFKPEQSPVYLAALELIRREKKPGAGEPDDAGKSTINIQDSYSRLNQDAQALFLKLIAL